MIDIIIPAFDAHDTITKTLLSIANQYNVEELNVYIVNDASKNDYTKEIERFISLMNIKEIRLKENGGPGVARQFGIDNSNSEFIMFIDADDIFCSTFSTKVLLDTISSLKADVVISSFYEECENGVFFDHEDDRIWLHGKIYRRSFLEKNNIRFNNTYSNEDNGFNQLVFLHNSKVETIDEFTYLWRYNKNSITRKNMCEYDFDCLYGYIYNITWALNIAIDNNCEYQKISEQAFITLVAIYYYYMDYMYNLDVNNLLKWSKCLYDIYMRYPIKDKTEKNELFQMQSKYSFNYTNTQKIPQISFEEFLNLVKLH